MLAAFATFVGVVVVILLDGGAASQTASPAHSARSSLFHWNVEVEDRLHQRASPGRLLRHRLRHERRRQRAAEDDQRRGPWCDQEGAHAWSPDGREIAIVNSSRIYVLNADGSGERRLSSGRAPSWSPDGRRIAFVRGDPDHALGSAEIFVMNADGTESGS